MIKAEEVECLEEWSIVEIRRYVRAKMAFHTPFDHGSHPSRKCWIFLTLDNSFPSTLWRHNCSRAARCIHVFNSIEPYLQAFHRASTINEGVDSISNHSSAFAFILDAVLKHADINLDQIRFICHRVVHGRDFREPVKIDQGSYAYIEHFSNLAPLYVFMFWYKHIRWPSPGITVLRFLSSKLASSRCHTLLQSRTLIPVFIVPSRRIYTAMR